MITVLLITTLYEIFVNIHVFYWYISIMLILCNSEMCWANLTYKIKCHFRIDKAKAGHYFCEEKEKDRTL